MTWIVCEDGDEYLLRLERFLGQELRFVPARDAAELLAAVGRGATGVLLDLDFRRTPLDRLIDEHGGPAPAPERARLAAAQGLHLARLLRARGHALPIVLFADLDDPARAAHLERTLAPLAVVGSAEGLRELAARLRALQSAYCRS